MNTLYLVICRWLRIISRVHRSKFKLHLMLKLTRHLMYSKCADRRLEVDLSAPSTDLPQSQTNQPTNRPIKTRNKRVYSKVTVARSQTSLPFINHQYVFKSDGITHGLLF